MKKWFIIVPAIGFLLTLCFELVPGGIRRDWFLFTDVNYPDVVEDWGNMAGKSGVTLQHYLNGLGNQINMVCLMFFAYLITNNKHLKVLTVLYIGSLINYVLNYHQPIIGIFDMNYVIGIYYVYLVVILTLEKWNYYS